MSSSKQSKHSIPKATYLATPIQGYSMLTTAICILCFSSISSAQNTILWNITKPNSDNKSYLLGTYHLMGNSFIDSLPQIEQALNQADLAIFESIDPVEKTRAFLNSRTDNFGYKDILKKSDLAYLAELEKNWSVPISKVSPPELLTKLQQTYLAQKCGTVRKGDNWDSFEDYLIYLAESSNIKTYGLETTDKMIFNLNTAAREKQTWKNSSKAIHKILVNIEKSKGMEKQCQAAWDYMNLEFNYQFDVVCGDNRMLKGRNEAWIATLNNFLTKESCFVAVGLLHLFGDCGLIMQLQALGYTVEPVTLIGKS